MSDHEYDESPILGPEVGADVLVEDLISKLGESQARVALLERQLEALRGKLDEMQLHDDTGDPRDEGYMAAVRELRDWLSSHA